MNRLVVASVAALAGASALVCGADASASFDRGDFGVRYGDKYGFKMVVKLQIQMEGSPEG